MRRTARAATALALGLVILVPLFPLYWMVISALKGPEELQKAPPTWFPSHVTFSAFGEVFQAVPFGSAFANSVLIAGVSTLSVLVTSVMAGFVFAKYRFRGRDLLFWSVVATMFLPPIVTLVPLYWLVSTMGLADSYLGVMLPWLANAFGIFLMRQFIADVPDELIEAARLDGASRGASSGRSSRRCCARRWSASRSSPSSSTGTTSCGRCRSCSRTTSSPSSSR